MISGNNMRRQIICVCPNPRLLFLKTVEGVNNALYLVLVGQRGDRVYGVAKLLVQAAGAPASRVLEVELSGVLLSCFFS